MRLILTMAMKDLKLLLRDRMAFFFTFFFPLVYAVFFGTIFSGGGSTRALSILAVDEDRTEQSRAFLDRLTAGPELKIEEDSLDSASEKVRKGSRVAFLVLPEGFGDAKKNPFLGGSPKVKLGVDPKRQAEAGMLQGILTRYAAEDLQKLFQDPSRMQSQMDSALESADGAPPEIRDSLSRLFSEVDLLMKAPGADGEAGFSGMNPLEIEEVPVVVRRSGPQNPFEISFPQGIIWGIMSCSFGFALSLVLERKSGTLVRMQTAPVSRTHILAGKAAACFLTITGLATLLFIMGRLIFGVAPESPLLLLMAVVSISIGFVGIMMFLSVLGRSEQSVSGLGWAILLISAMIGGGMVPLFILPGWMQTASHISPVKWSILAMEGALWRQFSFAEMLFPCAILIGIGAVCFLVGVRAFRWNIDT